MGGRVSCLTHFFSPLFQGFDLRREGQGWWGGHVSLISAGVRVHGLAHLTLCEAELGRML